MYVQAKSSITEYSNDKWVIVNVDHVKWLLYQCVCILGEQVDKFKAVIEVNKQNEKEWLANKNKRKKEKNRQKQKLQRENDPLFQMKCKALNQN